MRRPIVFVVGRKDPEPRAWEFIGVFEKEEDAVAACLTDHHCVCPVRMNENVESGASWPDAYYPIPLKGPQEARP